MRHALYAQHPPLVRYLVAAGPPVKTLEWEPAGLDEKAERYASASHSPLRPFEGHGTPRQRPGSRVGEGFQDGVFRFGH